MTATRRKGSGKTTPPAAVALRRLAAGLRTSQTAGDLLRAFGEAVRLLPGLESARFSSDTGEIEFTSESLTVPLVAASGTLGVMSVGPGEAQRKFHASQLQVAAAVADAVSAVLEQFENAHSQASTLQILETALGGLPVGIMCFRADGSRLFVNSRCAALLGERVPQDWASVWSVLAPETRKNPGSDFILQEGLHLLHVVARQGGEGGPRAVVITDLAPQAAAFSEGLTVDILRSGERELALCLGLVASQQNSPDAFRLVESLQPLLPEGARVGPVSAESAGIVVRGVPPASLLALIREHCRAQKLKSVRVGVAALLPGKDDAERLLARAMARLQDVGEEPRPDVFVADRSPAVADSLAVALRRVCRVVVSAPDADGLGILADQPFDGIFLELPEPDAPAVVGWVRRALELQPTARPFFVTEVPGPWDLGELGLPEAPVFRKPFVVREVRETLDRALVSAE